MLWRISISSRVPYTLGDYEQIALEILKNKRPDNPDLFVPLIYRKETNSSIDVISGVLSKEVMGNREVSIRFPDYEIVFITDMSLSDAPQQAELLKTLFCHQQINIYKLIKPTPFDMAFIQTMQILHKKYHK